MQTKTIMNYSVLALIVGALAYAGVQQAKEYKQAPFNQQLLETQREADKAAEQEKVDERNTGFVDIRIHKNAFDEVIGKTYYVTGISEGSGMFIYEKENRIDDVCFSVITGSDTYQLFSPNARSVDVYVKFDGGETKTFKSRRGKSGDLCVDRSARFMESALRSSKVEVALPFLNYSDHVTQIYEFNLKMLNGIAQ